MKFITLIFKFLLLITLLSSNVYSFENKSDIKIRPLKTSPFQKYDFDKLQKIQIPVNFPTHRAMGWEYCKNSKGQSWRTQLTFYISKDLAWGIKSNTKFIRVYMTQKIKNSLRFRVYEASKEWKSKKDWISGYKINLATDLSSSLKKEIKGKYVSKGGYWRSCIIKFDTINEAKDTLTKSDWLTLLKREQVMALHRLNFYGLTVTQKYDFEGILAKFDKKLATEVKASKLANKKAKKIKVDEKNAIKLAKNNFKNQYSLKSQKNSEISNSKTNIFNNENISYLKVKTFKSSNDIFDYNSLKKINLSNTFPRYRLAGEERCKSNKSTNNKWKNSIIFYGDENFLWGVRDYSIKLTPEKGVRIYMGIRKKDKIVFKVMETHEKWDNMSNWINGYSLDLKNKSLENALKQTLRGKYASSGSYRRQCELKFVRIIKTKDTFDHLKSIEFLEKQQRKALEQMNKLGFTFVEKYDFEKIKLLTKEFYNKEQNKLAEQKAKKLAQEKAKKLEEQKTKRKAEEKAKKLAEEKAKKLEEQKTKRKAEEKAKKLAEEKAKKLEEQKTKRKAEEKAKKMAEEKAKKLEEQKAKRKAEEKAKKLAEQKAKREVEEKAKREAEEKAKLIAKKKEEEIIKNSNWFRKSSEGFKRILKADNYIFNFKNPQKKELNVLHSKINKYLQLSYTDISNEEILKLKKTIQIYNELFKKVHNANKKSGVYGKFNYQNIPVKLEKNLEEDFREINQKLIQFITILNSFFDDYVDLKNETNDELKYFMKSKFDENEYNYITKIISKEKISELVKIDRRRFKYFFLMKASYHISLGKKVDRAIKEWLETYQGNFVSYYNKKIYNISINKNLKEIEIKQKNEEDFFNNIVN